MLLTASILLLLCAGLPTRGQYRFEDDPRNNKYPPYGGGFGSVEDEETTVAPDPLQGTSGNLSCYSCSLDFTQDGYDFTNPCLGRHGNVVHPDYLVKCGLNDVSCRVEWVELNNVLTSMERVCTDSCQYGCRPQGFGINILKCADCCNVNGCNAHDPKIDSGGTAARPGSLSLGAPLSWMVVAIFCHALHLF